MDNLYLVVFANEQDAMDAEQSSLGTIVCESAQYSTGSTGYDFNKRVSLGISTFRASIRMVDVTAKVNKAEQSKAQKELSKNSSATMSPQQARDGELTALQVLEYLVRERGLDSNVANLYVNDVSAIALAKEFYASQKKNTIPSLSDALARADANKKNVPVQPIPDTDKPTKNKGIRKTSVEQANAAKELAQKESAAPIVPDAPKAEKIGVSFSITMNGQEQRFSAENDAKGLGKIIGKKAELQIWQGDKKNTQYETITSSEENYNHKFRSLERKGFIYNVARYK